MKRSPAALMEFYRSLSQSDTDREQSLLMACAIKKLICGQNNVFFSVLFPIAVLNLHLDGDICDKSFFCV